MKQTYLRWIFVLTMVLCFAAIAVGATPYSNVSSVQAQSAETPTPQNAPPGGTNFPAVDPLPPVAFAGDNFERVNISDYVLNSIGTTLLSFVNINDRPATRVLGTPTAANQLETVFIIAPNGGAPTRVIDLPATVGQQVYWSPNGAYLAYFVPTGSARGLYLLDLRVGLTLRLFELDNINPRGIPSQPVWSPDSTQLTLSLPNPYDVDIFSIGVDGTNFKNLTQNGGFDFWPVWSPDGQYMAFVSDRAVCPTWVPNAPDSCYRPDVTTSDGGNLYVMEVVSGVVTKVSDEWVTAPPYWISSTRLSFTSGKRGDPTAGSSLWWADLRGGPAHKVSGDKAGILVTRDTWSKDGRRVVYQEADAGTNIVIRDDAGNEIARSTELNFPRVAFSASWSPDGNRLVMGGRNGQCPYGILLTDESFNVIVQSNPNPGVCEPVWSPGGQYIAFNGVTQTASGTDGRMDVFIAEASGRASRNVTGRYGGQIRMIGWIGGSGQ
jgi:Tol biopolymer transport system component